MRPLFLVGMMGSGKSCVGREVARLAGAPFCDLDRRVERLFGTSIAALVAAGEPVLRARETAALASLVDEPGFGGRPIVVATGGGTPIAPENRARMRSSGVVVLLAVPLSVLAERLRDEASTRPLLAGAPLADRLAELWAAREAAYTDGTIAIEAGGGVDQVAASVHARWIAEARTWTPG